MNGIVFCFSKFFSRLFRTVGLTLPLLWFSCPEPDSPEEGDRELPLSEVELNARLSGLFGDMRVLDDPLGGTVFERLADRKDSFTLDGKGFASGDGVCTEAPDTTFVG